MSLLKKKNTILIVAGILLISTVLVLFLSDDIGAQSESKGQIAYVDLWAVFNVHPEKSVAETELNKLAQTMQTELEEKAKELPKDQQQELLKEYQTRLSQKEQELIQNIIDSIKQVVIKVAEEKEVKMVLDKKNVIYGGYDMTEDVISYIQENNDAVESSAQGETDEPSLNQNEETLGSGSELNINNDDNKDNTQ